MTKVTIREFSRNIYKYLKLNDTIEVTKDNKPFFVVTFCRDNIPCSDTINVMTRDNLVTKDIVVTKQDIISNLKSKISDIEQYKPEKKPDYHSCEACMKLRRISVPAVGSFEVDEGDKIRTHWLCETHSPKVLV